MYDFETSWIGQLENFGSLSYAEFANVLHSWLYSFLKIAFIITTVSSGKSESIEKLPSSQEIHIFKILILA